MSTALIICIFYQYNFRHCQLLPELTPCQLLWLFVFFTSITSDTVNHSYRADCCTNLSLSIYASLQHGARRLYQLPSSEDWVLFRTSSPISQVLSAPPSVLPSLSAFWRLRDRCFRRHLPRWHQPDTSDRGVFKTTVPWEICFPKRTCRGHGNGVCWRVKRPKAVKNKC